MNNEYYFYNAPNGVTLLKNKRFDAHSELRYAFSTRKGGVSTGECDSLNLSWKRRDSEENVKENHCRLANAMGINARDIAFVQLTHSSNVLFITRQNRNDGRWWQDIPVGYDAVITADTGVALLARTADCGNVLLFDPVRRVISAVHSGWKGTAAGVICNAVNAMVQHYGCNPADIEAVFGPSICPDCFLVHNDCADAFTGLWSKQKYGRLMPDGRYSIDLWRIMYEQLTYSGVLPDNISRPDLCTCCNSEYFFSHRRGHCKSGIMLAVIELSDDTAL